MKRIGFVSLGCEKNLVDTEVMMGMLGRRGYEMTPHPVEADVIVVNTCGFIDKAKKESIDTILEMAEFKNSGNCSRLVVTGCLVERYRAELAAGDSGGRCGSWDDAAGIDYRRLRRPPKSQS